MSKAESLLVQSVSHLFSDACTLRELAAAEQRVWPEALWLAVAELGLPAAFADEAEGVFGIPIVAAFGIVRLAGEFELAAVLLGLR